MELGNILNAITDEDVKQRIQSNLRTLSISTPVKKINLSESNPHSVAGMYILSTENGLERIKSKADMSDVNSDTILFFANQHIVELIDFLNGMWILVENIKYIDKDRRINGIRRYMNLLQSNPTYGEYCQYCKRLTTHFESNFNVSEKMKKVYETIENITLYLPFISYNELDEIVRDGIEDFKSRVEDKNNEN